MYKAKFLQPQPRTGPDTVLHLKLHDGPNWQTAGPVLHAFDYSLNNHPGTLKGTAAFKHPGVDLDGDSDYIEIADHADFTPISTAFSISAWIYMHDASYFEIATKGMEEATGEWLFGVRFSTDVDQLSAELFDESEADCFIGRCYSAALTSYENSWIHVAWTYDGGKLCSSNKLYLNGVRVDDTDKEQNKANFDAVEAGGEPVLIGLYPVVAAPLYADGLIDDVKIHKKELSAAEMLNDYNLTKWRYGK